MAKSHQCPFCKNYFPLTNDTYHDTEASSYLSYNSKNEKNDKVLIAFTVCPKCEQTEVRLLGIGENFKGKLVKFYPDSDAKIFPDYIPLSIRQDYEEACKILYLSPKASATLSRRCLQGIIRDYWKISKGTLVDEIKAVETKVDPDTQDVLHSLRKLGNIGAHPEKDISLIVDIDPDEAQQLILFLEYLFEEWYIKTHNRKSMLQKIKDISKKKDEERKSQ